MVHLECQGIYIYILYIYILYIYTIYILYIYTIYIYYIYIYYIYILYIYIYIPNTKEGHLEMAFPYDKKGWLLLAFLEMTVGATAIQAVGCPTVDGNQISQGIPTTGWMVYKTLVYNGINYHINIYQLLLNFWTINSSISRLEYVPWIAEWRPVKPTSYDHFHANPSTSSNIHCSSTTRAGENYPSGGPVT